MGKREADPKHELLRTIDEARSVNVTVSTTNVIVLVVEDPHTIAIVGLAVDDACAIRDNLSAAIDYVKHQ